MASQVAVLAVISLGVLGARRSLRVAPDRAAAQRTLGLGEVAAFACGMVLLSPQSSKSHFCVWLFPAAFLADRVLRGRRDPLGWATLGAVFVLGTLTAKGIVTKDLGARINAYGNVTWCTVLLLVATTFVLWRSGSGDARETAQQQDDEPAVEQA
jgi:hypothetical protein